jgi:putative SOS response-associated peptidase YedK
MYLSHHTGFIRLFRVVNRCVGNLAPMPGVFPDYPAPVIRNTDNGSELVMMRWGMAQYGGRMFALPVATARQRTLPEVRDWPILLQNSKIERL